MDLFRPSLGHESTEEFVPRRYSEARVGPLPVRGNARLSDVEVQRNALRRQPIQNAGTNLAFTER